eukprot:g1897.t1
MWYVGVIISILGSTCNCTGQNIQKYAQNRPDAAGKEYTRLWRWWIGLSFVIVGSCGDIVALLFAPQSVVMPVGALTLVLNIAIAHFIMGESFDKNDMMATVLIVIGACNVAVAYGVLGENQVREFSLNDLMEMYRKWMMLLYMVGVAGIISSLFWVLRRCEVRARLVFEGTPVDPASQLHRWHPICYAGMSGIFGSCSVLMAASMMQLIKTTFRGENQFKSYEGYLILVLMVAFIALQTHFLALGLKYFDSLFIVPVFQCFFIIFSILGGAIYFRELDDFTGPQWALFLVAVGITLCGILLMSSRKMTIFSHDDRAPKTESGERLSDERPRDGSSDRILEARPKLDYSSPFCGVGFVTLQTKPQARWMNEGLHPYDAHSLENVKDSVQEISKELQESLRTSFKRVKSFKGRRSIKFTKTPDNDAGRANADPASTPAEGRSTKRSQVAPVVTPRPDSRAEIADTSLDDLLAEVLEGGPAGVVR